MQGIHLTVLSRKSILLEPGVSLDPSNPQQYALEISSQLQKNQIRCLIYDLKSLPLIDQTYYDWLNYLHTLCSLNNAELVLVHMSPSAAYGLSRLIDHMPPFQSALSIESARHFFE